MKSVFLIDIVLCLNKLAIGNVQLANGNQLANK